MILHVDKVSKSFGSHRVLDEVSLSVDSGEVVGLLGHNGAGKTTLLRIVTRLLEPDGGQVLFDGHPMANDDMAFIGYLPEERGLYRRMKAMEQALYFARLKGMPRRQAMESLQMWFERMGMTGWEKRPAGRLSKGMQQKLQFVVTVAHSPRLLILDEPFSGFDADNAALLKEQIDMLRRQGTAILLSTHNLQAADELCNKTITL